MASQLDQSLKKKWRRADLLMPCFNDGSCWATITAKYTYASSIVFPTFWCVLVAWAFFKASDLKRLGQPMPKRCRKTMLLAHGVCFVCLTVTDALFCCQGWQKAFNGMHYFLCPSLFRLWPPLCTLPATSTWQRDRRTSLTRSWQNDPITVWSLRDLKEQPEKNCWDNLNEFFFLFFYFLYCKHLI